ncbi:MAG: two-component regulator propeller domain-containing protein [Pyrinomonadaceae bacterium]
MSFNEPNKSKLYFAVAVAAVLACLTVSLHAQNYGYDTWTTANGLPQNTVTEVVQTPDGYLWLSTFDGLARFDGVRFTIFDKGNSPGILNNRFTGLLADSDGVVWASTENGVVTTYRNGIFTSYPTPETWNSPIGIIRGAGGQAIIETFDAFYSLQDGKFVPTPDRKVRNDRQIYYASSGAKWTLTRSAAVREKDGQSTTYALALPSEFLVSTRSLPVYEDRRGALWTSFEKRLVRLMNGTVSVFTPVELPALGSLNLRTILDTADGGVGFLFETGDLAQTVESQFVRFKDDQFTAYKLGRSVGASFSLTDREGNFWLASATGLRRLRPQLITTLSVTDGLINNEVYPLLQTAAGDVFIGTSHGISRYSAGKLTDSGLKYASNGPLNTRGLWEDPQARLWIGFQGEGGFGRFSAPASVSHIGKDDLPNGATDFAADSAGNIWIATEEGLYEYRDDQKIAHYGANDGLPSGRVITLHFNRAGNLWLGTFDGLAQFKDGKFISYNTASDSPKGFVRAIYEDADGVLWFGTYADGLVRYKDGKFFNYRVEHGLFNNGVFSILEDDRGNVWMSSNRGIHRVAKQELNDLADGKITKLNSVSYDERDGMLSAECNGGRISGGIKTKDGKLWFATMGGVAIVDPAAERLNPLPPPVLIEKVAVDRKAVDQPALQTILRDPRGSVQLEPGQTSVEIEFTGLSLIKSEQVKFKYKLDGIESDWIDAGTRRTANYSYLPPGTYTFRVIAANANGVWNNNGATLRIIVRPHFYQTWWFRTLAAVFVAFAVGLIFYTRVSHLRKIADTKTAFSRQLIESQEAERKRIASELHDGLGQSLVVIKNRAMLGLKRGDDSERVAKELNSISDSAAQALDEVREITNNLRPQLLDRLGLTKALTSMCKKMSGVVEVECDVADIDHIFNEHEEISLYRIVQESLNNIIKHSSATDASVIIKREPSRVIMQIKDNGRGFDPATVRSGLGLTGLRERAQLLHGELSIESKSGEGATINVNIPINSGEGEKGRKGEREKGKTDERNQDRGFDSHPKT